MCWRELRYSLLWRIWLTVPRIQYRPTRGHPANERLDRARPEKKQLEKISIAPHRFRGPRFYSGFRVDRLWALSFVQRTWFLLPRLDRLHGRQHPGDRSHSLRTESIAMGAASAGSSFVLLQHRA